MTSHALMPLPVTLTLLKKMQKIKPINSFTSQSSLLCSYPLSYSNTNTFSNQSDTSYSSCAAPTRSSSSQLQFFFLLKNSSLHIVKALHWTKPIQGTNQPKYKHMSSSKFQCSKSTCKENETAPPTPHFSKPRIKLKLRLYEIKASYHQKNNIAP